MPSVLVSVDPALLGSLLARLIESDSVSVTVMPQVPAAVEASRYTVAVTSRALPHQISAGTVIRLPDPERHRHAGIVHREDGDTIVRMITPDDVVALVQRLLEIP